MLNADIYMTASTSFLLGCAFPILAAPTRFLALIAFGSGRERLMRDGGYGLSRNAGQPILHGLGLHGSRRSWGKRGGLRNLHGHLACTKESESI